MNEVMEGLVVCNPTKINEDSFWIDLSQGYRLIIYKDGHGIWGNQVFQGSDKDGWWPQHAPADGWGGRGTRGQGSTAAVVAHAVVAANAVR